MLFLVRATQVDGGSEFEAVFDKEVAKEGVRAYLFTSYLSYA
jgi:hypothetical protein